MATLIKHKRCAMCHHKLTLSTVARWNIPGTDKHNTIRLDSIGREWCKKCTDEFDNIDWEAVRNK